MSRVRSGGAGARFLVGPRSLAAPETDFGTTSYFQRPRVLRQVRGCFAHGRPLQSAIWTRRANTAASCDYRGRNGSGTRPDEGRARGEKTALRRRRTRSIGMGRGGRNRCCGAAARVAMEEIDDFGMVVGGRLSLGEESTDRAVVVRQPGVLAVNTRLAMGRVVVVRRHCGVRLTLASLTAVVDARRIMARSVPEERVEPLPKKGRAAEKDREKPAELALGTRSHLRNRRRPVCKKLQATAVRPANDPTERALVCQAHSATISAALTPSS